MGFRLPDNVTARENLALCAVVAGSLLISTAVAAVVTASKVRGEERHYLELYSGPPGQRLQRTMTGGPFPDTARCHAVGAMVLDALADLVPDRDYRAKCSDDPAPLAFPEMLERAKALLAPGT